MRGAYNNSFFDVLRFPKNSYPDEIKSLPKKINDDFVLCRDEAGNATAIYGDSKWDFNPYRLSQKRINIIYFSSLFKSNGKNELELINELKRILFLIIYETDAGHTGRISPSTLVSYWKVFRKAAHFCLSQVDKPLVGILTLQQLFSNHIYMACFIKEHAHINSFNKRLPGIIKHLISLRDSLGYKVCTADKLPFGSKDTNQTPVIPMAIYLKLINILAEKLDAYYPYRKSLSDFISRFDDPWYGTQYKTEVALVNGSKIKLRQTLPEAIEKDGLSELFCGELAVRDKHILVSRVSGIQYIIKNILHLYTGMRDEEVLRLKYDCLLVKSENVLGKFTINQKNSDDRIIHLISSTTKFTGYKKPETWLAPPEVRKAIEIAQCICKGLSKMYDGRLEELPLFISPNVITRKKSRTLAVNPFTTNKERREVENDLIITKEDLSELEFSDPSRDFISDERFSLGSLWPLTSHQYRRSLAFYASSSGFVSLPSLKKQFKHVTRQMTQYYANNFENIKTIFGYYDPDKGEHILPSGHIAFEFQMGMPANIAYQILTDVLQAHAPLFGGTGSFIEKQREHFKSGEISIEQVRLETEKRIARGELAYRETLLGGCTKLESCDDFMLGNTLSCLNCEGAIINKDKLDITIQNIERELSDYEPDSGEYQITHQELLSLNKFKKRSERLIEKNND